MRSFSGLGNPGLCPAPVAKSIAQDSFPCFREGLPEKRADAVRVFGRSLDQGSPGRSVV